MFKHVIMPIKESDNLKYQEKQNWGLNLSVRETHEIFTNLHNFDTTQGKMHELCHNMSKCMQISSGVTM